MNNTYKVIGGDEDLGNECTATDRLRMNPHKPIINCWLHTPYIDALAELFTSIQGVEKG